MIRTFGRAVLFLCVALPAAAAQNKAADSRPPSALELMLAGHVCGEPKSQDPADQDARERCVGEQRGALRAEFGYDLSRLSAPERRKLDATCSRLRTNYDVESYLQCLTQGLVTLRARWTPERSDQPSFGPQTVAAPEAPPPAPTRRSSATIITLLVGAVLAVIAVAAVALKKRRLRAERLCRDCGIALQSAGDLCPACRHSAATALKQSIADHAEQERRNQEARRLQQEEAEERQRLREEQEARLQREEAARHAELARRAAEAPAPAPAATSSQPADDMDDMPGVLDPYAVLSVSPEASQEQIEAAYHQARSKYDEALVSHLGNEVQMYFKLKAEAVEDAYQTLTRSIPA